MRWGSPSISRVLSWTAIPLGVPLPARSSSLPGSDASNVIASLFGLAPDGVYRAVRVAASAVSSYLAVSPLPDPARFREGHRRSVLCCTFRRLRLAAYSARPLAGILLCGARTFLPAHEAPGGCLTDFPGADYTRPPAASRTFSPGTDESSSTKGERREAKERNARSGRAATWPLAAPLQERN